jgi:hypothetical protein
MRPMHQSQPDELMSLQMENELLTLEVRHLRARLRAVGVDPQSASGGESEVVPSQYEQAYRDVRWLIRRLNNSPAGIVLRRREGFRALVKRYGRDAGR